MDVVQLTESAKEQMTSMLKEHNKPAIKLQMQGGGCAGFKYDWSLDETIEDKDEVIELDNARVGMYNTL